MVLGPMEDEGLVLALLLVDVAVLLRDASGLVLFEGLVRHGRAGAIVPVSDVYGGIQD